MSETNTPKPERLVMKNEGENIRLMQLAPDDAQSYYALLTRDIEHISSYDDSISYKYPNPDAFRAELDNPINPDVYRFGIWDGDTLVGGTNLIVSTSNRAEVGFWTGKPYAGNGYAIRGQKLLQEFAFKTLGLRELFCEIVSTNTASIDLVERLGYTRRGEFVDDTNTSMKRYVLANPILADM